MSFAEPFVRRPVATTLLTIGLALAGALSYQLLPVSPLPQVDFPTISVTASLPGASPETMAATVATPLERALGKIAGVNEITSNSTLGNTRVTLQFDLNRSIDGAARDVQAAINASRSELPTSLPRNPVYRKVNPADAPFMILALTSDTFDRGQMYDAASTLVAEKLSQIKGVGQVTVGGASLPAVRVELNPAALNKYAIGFDEVRAAINATNANRPKGVVEDGDKQWQIYANDQAHKAAQYIPLIVAYRSGAAVRLGDVAEVVDSVQDLRNAGISNGKPAVIVQLFRQPGANIIETADRVRAVMPQLGAALPGEIDMKVAMERTTTPMMCARLLRKREPGQAGRLSVWCEAVFNGVLRLYERTLGWSLRHPLLVMLVLGATIGLNVYMYNIVPKGFFPQQDTGRIGGGIVADQASSFQAMRVKLAQFVEIIERDPAVESVTGFTGGGQRNGGFVFISLKPLKERGLSADQVVAKLRPKLAAVAGANLFLSPMQDIRIGGRQSNTAYQFTLRSDNLEDLRKWTPLLQRALQDLPQLADVNSDQQVRGLQTTLTIDRETASRMGITTRAIDTALNLAYGQAQVSTIYSSVNQYRVVMEVAPQYWQGPEALDKLYLVSPTRGQVPLSAVARYELTNTALAVNHQGQFAAATISFNLPIGVALSDAVTAVNAEMARLGVPTTIHGSFQGTARAFQASLESQPWLILAALITVYIVLGILYESFIHPITILSTLPSAGVGALLALWFFNTEFNNIAMIGVILLIGIVKKNAIMMIDFAIAAERDQKIGPREAIYQACVLRFRPIMMTTAAALLGAVPLALGAGDGAELRQPLGIAIVGGLVMSQLLTLYTTPVVYLYIDRFRLWFMRLRGKTVTLQVAEGRP